MQIKQGHEETYKEWKETNNYGLGIKIFDHAVRWANLMESRLKEKGELSQEEITRLSYDANVHHISNYMYDCSVQVLIETWEYGAELKIWSYINSSVLHHKINNTLFSTDITYSFKLRKLKGDDDHATH